LIINKPTSPSEAETITAPTELPVVSVRHKAFAAFAVEAAVAFGIATKYWLEWSPFTRSRAFSIGSSRCTLIACRRGGSEYIGFSMGSATVIGDGRKGGDV
jgi:hypothetical protein